MSGEAETVAERYEERQRRADYREVFDSAAGRRVLADLGRFAHMDHPSYVRGDALETAFREGERNAVLRIHALLRRGRAAGGLDVSRTDEQQQEVE